MFKIIFYTAVLIFNLSCANSVNFSVGEDNSKPSGLLSKTVWYTQSLNYKPSNKQVDILLVIDNSKSMIDEHAKIIEKFKDNFIPYLRDLNWRIGILTTDDRDIFAGGFFSRDEKTPTGFGGKLLRLNTEGSIYLHRNTENLISLFKSTIRRIACNSKSQESEPEEELETEFEENISSIFKADSPLEEENKAFCFKLNGLEKPFGSIIKSIEKKDSHNVNFFRDKAHLISIIISDEDEDDSSNLQATDVVEKVKTQWPKKLFRSYSLSVLPGDEDCKQASSEDYNAKFGTKLVQLSQITKGASLSICQKNYTTVFKTISKGIYDSFLLKMDLDKVPVSGSLQLSLNPEPDYSFHYIVKDKQILFKEALDFDTTFSIKYLTKK